MSKAVAARKEFAEMSRIPPNPAARFTSLPARAAPSPRPISPCKPAQRLQGEYAVTVLPQAKKLGKQLGALEGAGYAAVAFFDNEDIKVLGQKGE